MHILNKKQVSQFTRLRHGLKSLLPGRTHRLERAEEEEKALRRLLDSRDGSARPYPFPVGDYEDF